MNVIAAIGGTSFVDRTELGQVPGWTASGNLPNAIPANMPGELSTEWFRLNGSGNLIRSFSPAAMERDANGRRFLEINFAWHVASGNGPSNQTSEVLSHYFGFGSVSNSVFAELGFRQDPLTLLNNVIHLKYTDSTNTEQTVSLDTKVEAGMIAFCTLRLQSLSAPTAADGAIQLSVNDKHITVENIDFNNTYGTFDDAHNAVTRFNGVSGWDAYLRNFFITDGFSTPLGDPPTPVHVYDHVPTSVIATDYTNEGGANDMVVAVGDKDDATYIESAIALAQASFGFTIPVATENSVILGLMLALRASRANGAFNNIELELRDGSGLVAVETVSKAVNVVDPSRERIVHSFTPTPGQQHNDFSIVIRNDT